MRATASRASRATRRRVFVACAVIAISIMMAACGGAHASRPAYGGALDVPAAPLAAGDAEVPRAAPPPFSDGIFPCSRCHGAGEPAGDDPVFTHSVHVDKGLECADCHEDDSDPSPADAEICDECHEPDDRGSERAKAYFTGLGDEFPSRWDTQLKHVAHDKHASADIACQACHGEIADAPIVKPGSAALMQRCMTCHAERGAPETCETCHEQGITAPHANVVLHHAEEQRGCLDCHDRNNRDVLHLANGAPVSFDESFRLCGQCHGPRLRDWKLGLHGKRLGGWEGGQEALLCAHCHNPHSPRFPLMTPLPPPRRPARESGRLTSADPHGSGEEGR